MRVRAKAKGIPLQLEYASQMPESIQCDPLRLRQILVNLVGNAIKFTESGKVRVVTRLVQSTSRHSAIQFDVIDTGIGMTPQQCVKLFQPFSQADTSTTRRFGGTGLGLGVAEGIIKEHGGVLIAGNRPGPITGAIFEVMLPVEPVLAGNEPPDETSPGDR